MKKKGDVHKDESEEKPVDSGHRITWRRSFFLDLSLSFSQIQFCFSILLLSLVFFHNQNYPPLKTPFIWLIYGQLFFLNNL